MPDSLATLLSPSPLPLITYYDVRTGERVELSAATTANWVAKVANFLVEDCDGERGTRLRIGLPSHWLRFVWLLGAWRMGAIVTDHNAEIALVGPELEASEEIRLAASLRPLGARFAQEPSGFIDTAIAVPASGDVFIDVDPPEGDDLALDLGSRTVTHAELLSTEPSSERLLRQPADLAEDAVAIVSAIAGGGSLVIVKGAGTSDLAKIASQERAQLSQP